MLVFVQKTFLRLIPAVFWEVLFVLFFVSFVDFFFVFSIR